MRLFQRKMRGSASDYPQGSTYVQEPKALLAALALPRQGMIFDLDAGRWPGMPILDAHPPYLQTTFRTPRGSKVDGDLAVHWGPNTDDLGVVTELIAASTHSGTHIDALCHITTHGRWFGGSREIDSLGDFGAKTADAASIAPIVCRGVLLDIPAVIGEEPLAAGRAITRIDMEAAISAEGLQVVPGDAVLVRTGYMTVWDSEPSIRARHYGAGIDREAAAWLADRRPVMVGSDTENLERIPAGDDANPLPAHVELLVKHGIHIAELLYLEDLAEAKAYEFLFVCLPLRLQGATGSMVRPVAIT